MPANDRPAAILFDLDGTLVDSLPDLHGAMNVLLDELGRPPVTAASVRSWVGDGAAVLVERAIAASGGWNGHDKGEVIARYLRLYESRVAELSRPFPGVEATLRRLAGAGHALGVCTNKPTDLSVELLSAVGLAPLFAAIVGGDAVDARKPAPQHLQATLAAMGLPGHRALMVGDSGNDVAAAKAAGIPVAVVAFGYSRVDPASLGADLLIDDFARLPDAAAAYL